MSVPTIDGKTRLTGIIGQPVSHSLSPLMHNTGFAHLKLNYAYVPLACDSTKLASLISGLRAIDFAGANITIPHKESLFDLVDEVGEISRLTGSVNTLFWQEQKLIATTTDGYGFIQNLKNHHFDPADKSVVLLGYGGSAKAVAFSLFSLGKIKHLVLSGRNETKAKLLMDELSSQGYSVSFTPQSELKAILDNSDLLINSTPIGMTPNTSDCPIDPQILNPNLTITDLIYNPRQTKLLLEAKKLGCTTIDGLGMLLWQGVKSFELWTGVKAPHQIMQLTLEKAFL